MAKLLNIVESSFKIRNKTETTAELTLYADIGENFWGDGISAKAISDELKSLPKSINQIDVRLNSFGGDVFEGVTIYNRLKQHPANITVYIDGMAASIASIIALAGNKIIMGEASLLMIHKPMSGVHGNSIEMEEMISRLDDVEEQLIGIYRRKTGLDRSEIKSMLAKETWIAAEEALELGFADSMMAEEDTLQVAAIHKESKCPWAKNNNKIGNNAFVKKQLYKFKQDAEAFITR